MNSGLRCMALSLVLVIVDAIDVHNTDVVVPIRHTVGTTTTSKDPMALSINQGSLLARALQTLHIDLV